ncbi:MAG: hypothetical protein ACP5KA_04625 [Desulfurococcaceae archaeon]
MRETRKDKNVEVIKVEIPRDLAEKFRKYVAEKYGFRRGALSKAVADLIERELAFERAQTTEGIGNIIGLGLLSDYEWKGEDIVEALRRRTNVSNRC